MAENEALLLIDDLLGEHVLDPNLGINPEFLGEELEQLVRMINAL